jgi:hypothetical protein
MSYEIALNFEYWRVNLSGDETAGRYYYFFFKNTEGESSGEIVFAADLESNPESRIHNPQ